MAPPDDDDLAKPQSHAGVTVTDVVIDAPGPLPVRVYLVVFAKEGPGHVLDLDDGAEVSFGRTPGATIVIDDPRISRKHAAIRRARGDVYVRDLGSRNGTKVRGDVAPGEERRFLASCGGHAIQVGPAEIVIANVIAQPLEERDVRLPAASSDAAFAFDDVVVADPAMQKVFRLARRLGQAPTTVLIAGETGVGKEVVAEQIHRWSSRAKNRFVRLNCASLAENLLESELFGHEKGAFTGADRRKIGFVEAAEGGTLLLDEVGEMPLSLQVKLLRVIETKLVVRLGALERSAVDVRYLLPRTRRAEG